MVMSVYLVLKFSSGLKGLKREGKRSEILYRINFPPTYIFFMLQG